MEGTQTEGTGLVGTRQVTAFPQPKSSLYIADAEANKVRLFYLELS